MNNPFSLTFGKEPVSPISQEQLSNEIIEGFTSENPSFYACMLTGVRGSGKTVLMTEIASQLRNDEHWIVIELNPERDLLQALAAELSNRKELLQIFRDAKINLSFFGFGIELDSEPPITDIVVALDRMLEQLTKKGKRVLITVDEAVSNQYIRVFASQFQIFIRKNYQLFLLMTGLYENIYHLQNEKTLTFLYRAPKFQMTPLNTKRIAAQYQTIFHISNQQANAMAELVKGYPYAYQVLGYLCFKKQVTYDKIIDEFDMYLAESVYDGIWDEMSQNDRKITLAIARSTAGKTEEIRRLADCSSSTFSVYRDRLLKKNLVRKTGFGYLEFTLPRFKEYVIEKAGSY